MTKKSDKNDQQKTGFTTLGTERYYRIAGFDRMAPFFMSIPSDTDLWMYISSNGGLAAGRVDAEGSLFPYETVDKLHDSHHHTGPVTLLRVERKHGPSIIWRPFSERLDREDFRERNLYKNTVGNRLVFEEINTDLGLRFRYRWSACDEFGLVRSATLENFGTDDVTIKLLDGLRNVLPFGAPLALHQQLSCLVDAYKRTDIDRRTGLGIFSLTAAIIDRAEAAEVLRANTVWCHGLEDFDVVLTAEAVDEFRHGGTPAAEDVLTGRRGNYLVTSSFALPCETKQEWNIVADAARSHVDIAALRLRLAEDKGIAADLENGLEKATDALRRNVGSADGIQLTGEELTAAHHFANVLFNNMRGGIFDHNYDIPTADFIDFVQVRNRPAAERRKALMDGVASTISFAGLIKAARDAGDADFERLCHEYLPIYFGRRHGDPSRPWNRFTIHVKGPDGGRALRYEGNWRDIFQNWEALGMSFPEFIPGFIAKFVNASTIDGFNPYRITRDGIDWEVVDPDDPWSYIGYWGDHQIIYLLKFLEALERFFPAAIGDLMTREMFSYANVPYRLKSLEKIVDNPRETVEFDQSLERQIEDRVRAIGTDGKLVLDSEGSVYHVTLIEKLLVPVLSKLSNLVLDGGIWMNTQRPEWNDANNALVGNGVSMVTLCYLRRHIKFIEDRMSVLADKQVSISNEVVDWFDEILSILTEHRPRVDSVPISNADRMTFLTAVGSAFSEYRRRVYSNGFSGKRDLPVAAVIGLCQTALGFLDHSIRANRRDDGLYNAYNLIEISSDRNEASLQPLYEMLEGQVAALSSGLVDAGEAASILSSLFKSEMYREDQKSFMLYPERKLPAFLDKNKIPEKHVHDIGLFRTLLEAGDSTIISRDEAGEYRFNGDFHNREDAAAALETLSRNDRWSDLVEKDGERVLVCFEEVFKHKSFTGRSGTMYGYEGLGCIYWHMVSKLLLAVQENVHSSAATGGDDDSVEELIGFYFRIREGLGFRKTTEEYGAFPADPYSHTPRHSGAQQPGMTGQVKEEILARFGELGVVVEDGIVSFKPALLEADEFLKSSGTFDCFAVDGSPRSVEVPAGSLAFSFCQTPIIYETSGAGAWIRVTNDGGDTVSTEGNALDAATSRSLFARDGRLSIIHVGVPHGAIRRPRTND